MDIPETRYAKAADGVHIAYQVVGDGPIDILFVLGWVTHLERMWTEPRFARFYTRLASFSRVMLFDKRGVGLSDRVSEDRLPSLEVRMDDARAVMDAVGSERAVVLGVSEGGPMAMLFAATYPERTIALTLFGTSACWNDAPDYPYRETEQEQTDFEAFRESAGAALGNQGARPGIPRGIVLAAPGRRSRDANVVGRLHALLGESGCRERALADEPSDRRPLDLAGDPRPHTGPGSRRRPRLLHGGDPLAGRTDPRGAVHLVPGQ